MNEDKYTIDNCRWCGKFTALKNQECIDCKDKGEMPQFFKDMLEGFDGERKE